MLIPILLAIGIPILLSCIMLTAGWSTVRRDATRALPWWSIAGAAAVGYAGGHLSLSGWPQFPPGDVTHWLPFVAVMALAAAAVLATRGTPVYVWVLRMLMACTVAGLLTVPLFKTLGRGPAAGIAAVLMLCTVAWFAAWDQVARRFAAVEFLFTAMIVSVGVSIALVLGRSAMLGQLAGAMAAATGPIFFTSIVLRKRPFILTPLVLVLVPILTGLVFLGNQFAYLPTAAVVLLFALPVLLAIASVTPLSNRPVYRWTSVGIALLLILMTLFYITRSLPAIELYEL